MFNGVMNSFCCLLVNDVCLLIRISGLLFVLDLCCSCGRKIMLNFKFFDLCIDII